MVSPLNPLPMLNTSDLSGDIFVNSIVGKVSGRLKFLYRHFHYFNQKLRKDLCSALLQCHIDYCCASWFTGLSKASLHKLQIIQNKMTRFILSLSPRDHIGQSELNSAKLLNIHNRAKQLRLNHMFNIFHSSAPTYLIQFFTKVSDIHSHATRVSPMNFHVPHVKGISAKSFFYQATLDWNGLPNNIKSLSHKSSFKSAVKTHLARSEMTQELAEFV